MKSNSSHKIFFSVLKVLLFILMSVLIYWQIKTRSADFNVIEAFKKGFAWDQFPFLLFAVLFMPVNIFLESLKWKVFVNQFQERFSITSSIKSMLCGSFFGFISPNRVGEFLGRLNRIDKDNRSRALTAGYWGGIAQFIITFSIGIYMGGRAIMHHVNINSLDKFTIPLAIVIIVFASTIYFNLKTVLAKISSFPYINKLTKKYPIEYDVPKSKLLLVLLITLFRYLVYVSQYVYLLYFFGVDLSYEVLFSSVCTMLVLHTMVPSVPFVDLGVKGNVLVLLLKNQTFNELGVLLAVFSIWIINIIVPAIVGYYYFVLAKRGAKQEESLVLN